MKKNNLIMKHDHVINETKIGKQLDVIPELLMDQLINFIIEHMISSWIFRIFSHGSIVQNAIIYALGLIMISIENFLELLVFQLIYGVSSEFNNSHLIYIYSYNDQI